MNIHLAHWLGAFDQRSEIAGAVGGAGGVGWATIGGTGAGAAAVR
jgi:hypothetical protein